MAEVSYIDLASQGDYYGMSVFEDEPAAGQRRVHNHEMNLAWRFIANTNVSVFLTGKAGTGKTTFLRKLKELTPKRMVVLAPTGVAAINAQGQTIHSFFQLPFGPMLPEGVGQNGERRSHYKMSKEKKNLIKTLDLLVIDEISMVRCDLLDAVDAELRKYKDRNKPFGGVQLLLIGDLQQLAPVAKESEWALLAPYYSTQYFFGSKALQQIMYVTVELKHIYRQQNEEFINVLAKIRNNQVDAATVATLNSRYVPGFVPPADEDWIRLTTHNRMADEYNVNMLRSLPGQDLHFYAEVKDNFPETSYPAEEDLVLKIGAQVMFLKNDPSAEHAYYNGKIGVVRSVTDEGIVVWSKEDKKNILVPQMEWENTKYVIDDSTKEIKEVVEGVFMQYPLRLAWAITVHKSQGLTFDHAVLDINDSFAHGQTYVALSRCRTLEGMVLARPIDSRSVITDANVNAYIDRKVEEARRTESQLPQMMYEYYLTLLNELFSFQTLYSDLRYLTRVVDEHLYSSFPDYLSTLKETLPRVEKELMQVAGKFAVQYQQMMAQSANFSKDEALQGRLHAASEYFFNKVHELLDPIIAQCALKIGNKQVSAQYNNALDSFSLSFKLKVGVFARIISERFNVKTYLNAKAKAALDEIVIKQNGVVQTEPVAVKKKEEKPKKEKIDTKAESFRMYKEGMSIKEIATERSLTMGTVENHLAHYVGTGVLSIDDVVSTMHQKFIRGIVKTLNAPVTLSDIKGQLPNDYSYAEIKMVLADMDKDKEKCQ